jgi:hypothetical protein
MQDVLYQGEAWVMKACLKNTAVIIPKIEKGVPILVYHRDLVVEGGLEWEITREVFYTNRARLKGRANASRNLAQRNRDRAAKRRAEKDALDSRSRT